MLKDEVLRLMKEKDVVILAHNYQNQPRPGLQELDSCVLV